jgi:hypothetical protein
MNLVLKEIYRGSLSEEEMIGAATVTCLKGVPTRLGEYKVQAGQVIALGFGEQSGLDNAIGRIFMDIRDNAASPGAIVKGKVRLAIYTPQDRFQQNLGEWDIDILNDNSTDRTKQTPFPFNKTFLTEDKKLVLELIAKADVTVGKTNSRVLFDTTEGVV